MNSSVSYTLKFKNKDYSKEEEMGLQRLGHDILGNSVYFHQVCSLKIYISSEIVLLIILLLKL